VLEKDRLRYRQPLDRKKVEDRQRVEQTDKVQCTMRPPRWGRIIQNACSVIHVERCHRSSDTTCSDTSKLLSDDRKNIMSNNRNVHYRLDAKTAEVAKSETYSSKLTYGMVVLSTKVPNPSR